MKTARLGSLLARVATALAYGTKNSHRKCTSPSRRSCTAGLRHLRVTMTMIATPLKKTPMAVNDCLLTHLLSQGGYCYFPTADQIPEVLTWGVKLRIYYSCEYLLLHEAFAHYFMILGLTKIWIRLFLPC